MPYTTSLLEKSQNLGRFAPASCCMGVPVQVIAGKILPEMTCYVSSASEVTT